ncbi:MAG: UDP-N-acetylmuramoyl-tripeptide--D-alanyl-D-alanine ligase [Clostridia bacterium]|nr:UDP-N-acetylmuramoyl-tripeptide--D-alanyl-D-alanine ligase [Clostridia bacterium]
MKPIKVEFLAKACCGELLGNKSATIFDVKIDSRLAEEGDLFVAVIGENKNGHDYAKGAFDAGCRSFLVSDTSCAQMLIGLDPSVCAIVTQDTVAGLVKIATAYLSLFNLRRIAVTGSVGKTTTKEMIACVLASKYKTLSTRKNLNTQLGQCLTAFLADDTTQAIVFEMGMDRKGEISEYCEWILPEIAVITNVGTAHLEKLGTREAIALAKLEIAGHLKENQPLIFNADSDFLSVENVKRLLQNTCTLCSVGCKPSFDFSLSEVKDLGVQGIEFKILDKKSDTTQAFKLALLGTHNARNAALAIAAGHYMGISMQEAAKALSQMKSTMRRLDLEEMNGITIIDDTYNAGPDSIKAAINTLLSVKGTRKIAILSDIMELGPLEEEGHLDVGRYVAEKGISILIAIGKRARHYVQGALEVNRNMKVLHYETKEAALSDILPMVQTGDVLLVKGSNSTMISELVPLIKEEMNKEGRPA